MKGLSLWRVIALKRLLILEVHYFWRGCYFWRVVIFGGVVTFAGRVVTLKRSLVRSDVTFGVLLRFGAFVSF